jgi:methylmalonyl-CoA mutase
VRNFYSVSISGYHIAEAGANPISQLAFTLSNGFTFVEAYLARGMHIDDFAPNLSFFFSNGMDPEYTVLGRVARRIWATAMRDRYGANERSQKLKYHIQTSGRSLHAQEIAFNDIRTTLQALIAVYDNCNSLHTNAYDEAITTPTEESVRRAMAIQLVINREWGLAKNENPNQGAFVIDELTELVEEAVLAEFERIAERGGVLGAMETGYQRGRIQEESMHYEMLKHTGDYPIIGVNTFRNPHGDPVPDHIELARSTEDEKRSQLARLADFQRRHTHHTAPQALASRPATCRPAGRQRLRRTDGPPSAIARSARSPKCCSPPADATAATCKRCPQKDEGRTDRLALRHNTSPTQRRLLPAAIRRRAGGMRPHVGLIDTEVAALVVHLASLAPSRSG